MIRTNFPGFDFRECAASGLRGLFRASRFGVSRHIRGQAIYVTQRPQEDRNCDTLRETYIGAPGSGSTKLISTYPKLKLAC